MHIEFFKDLVDELFRAALQKVIAVFQKGIEPDDLWMIVKKLDSFQTFHDR